MPWVRRSVYGVRFSCSEVDLDFALGEHLADEQREGDEELVQLAVDLLVVLRALVDTAPQTLPEREALW